MKLETSATVQPESLEEWMAAEQQAADEQLENRERPNYTIVYKQAVRTEDMFLQMGCKTPGTASCEDMIVEIDLPNEQATIEAMQLDVARDTIDVRTPRYRLKMPLSQPVDPELGKAEYDAERRVLKLTLRMRRDLDFVNF
jgi:dynein assembly factor 6, axonemal